MTPIEFGELVRTRYEQNPNGRLDTVAEEYLRSDSFGIRIQYPDRNQTWSEKHIGTAFGSTVDYGDTWNDLQSNRDTAEAELKQTVRDRISKHPRQINFYDKERDTVYNGVIVKVTENGYSIYPDQTNMI